VWTSRWTLPNYRGRRSALGRRERNKAVLHDGHCQRAARDDRNVFQRTLIYCSSFPPQLFERLQDEQPGFAEKIVAVKSDLTQPELDLSTEDQSVLEERVDIVFHCAATIRFNEPLK